jgi:hypothetical protein
MGICRCSPEVRRFRVEKPNSDNERRGEACFLESFPVFCFHWIISVTAARLALLAVQVRTARAVKIRVTQRIGAKRQVALCLTSRRKQSRKLHEAVMRIPVFCMRTRRLLRRLNLWHRSAF